MHFGAGKSRTYVLCRACCTASATRRVCRIVTQQVECELMRRNISNPRLWLYCMFTSWHIVKH